MPRRVFYRIASRPDGLFDAIVTIEPAKVMRRDGFASLADAEDWADGLRVLMAAIGAPVAREAEPECDLGPRETAKPIPSGKLGA